MSRILDTLDVEKERLERNTLSAALGQCTESQRAFFLRLYPDGVNGMDRVDISSAIKICERTLFNNNKDDPK